MKKIIIVFELCSVILSFCYADDNQQQEHQYAMEAKSKFVGFREKKQLREIEQFNAEILNSSVQVGKAFNASGRVFVFGGLNGSSLFLTDKGNNIVLPLKNNYLARINQVADYNGNNSNQVWIMFYIHTDGRLFHWCSQSGSSQDLPQCIKDLISKRDNW